MPPFYIIGLLTPLYPEKFEGLGGLERFVRFPVVRGVVAQIEFHYASFFAQIEIFQSYPENIRGQCRFEEVDQILLIRHRTPPGGRNIRFACGGYAERYGTVADNAEYAGDRSPDVVGAGDNVDVV